MKTKAKGNKRSRFSVSMASMLAAGFVLMSCGSLKVADKGDEQEAKETVVVQTQLDATELKKKNFFDSLRPMVEAENERIAGQREFLMAMQKKHDMGKRISSGDKSTLLKLADEYEVEHANFKHHDFWSEMAKRVDTLPVELVLVQAANESAWGTSRFAREGNNYFGQWCYEKGCGIVPKQRPAGETYEVASYASPADSLHSYMENLNTSKAYEPLRDLRYKARQEKRQASATELVWGLLKYSERGKAYVRDICAMIVANRDLMQGDMQNDEG